jgi:hypothetical protein
MAASFSAFLVEVMRLLDGDEGSPTDLPLATLQQIIELGERRIYKDVRSRYNLKSFGAALISGTTAPVVVTNNLAPIPDDFESCSVAHFGNQPLQPVAQETLLDMNVGGTAGEAIYFATMGAHFAFSPAVADATELQGTYYCRLPALDSTTAPTNLVLENEKAVFIYGVLVEGAPIFRKFNELPLWEKKYSDAVSQANSRNEKAAYSAGRMRVRPSTRLMR